VRRRSARADIRGRQVIPENGTETAIHPDMQRVERTRAVPGGAVAVTVQLNHVSITMFVSKCVLSTVRRFVPLLSANTICNVPKLTTPTPTFVHVVAGQLKAEPFITQMVLLLTAALELLVIVWNAPEPPQQVASKGPNVRNAAAPVCACW